jgi:putative Holliday junction resolvase
MRILGLDVGTHRIGVAVSDESATIAQPLISLETNPQKAFMGSLSKLISEHEIDKIVVGLPLTLSGGNRNDSTIRAEKLGQRIESDLNISVVYFDERFTTTQAERVLIDAGVRRKGRRQVVDKMAASLILQGYLDSKSSSLTDEV